MKKVPLRMCVVTRNREDKRNLLRIVKDQENNVFVDVTGKQNGKGAYITKSKEVLEMAKKNKALDRALECEVPESIYEEIENSYPNMTSNEIRSLLGAFNFTGDEVFKRIGDLSGGEKVRVSLCKILNDRCNVLILDEPTNHLDIINKDTIEKMLTDYQGTVIVVSHDRYLIKEVCNKLLVLSNGESTLYKYGYSEYEEKKKEFSPGRKVENVKVKKVVSYNVKKEINKIENDIIRLEGKLKYLNDALLKKEVYTDIKKYNDVQKEIGAITSEIDNKTSMWDNLTKDI